MKRSRLIRAAAVLTSIALLVGCASIKGLSGKEEKKDSPVTITVWVYYNGAQLTAFNELVELFNDTVGQEKGIIVESYSQGLVNDLERNVLDAAERKAGADAVPNIFAAYADTAYKVDRMGLVADLRPYFSQEELGGYVDSYIKEGQFGKDGSIKIFPVAKSTELFLLNKTDWEEFAEATGSTYEDFSTLERLTETAQAYYEWTDSLTDIPNDGKAFFGRDAMANYFFIGAKQLGMEIFTEEKGKLRLNFDKDVIRKLWDNYYIPFVKGYFAASGRFRSDDVKTGNILAFVGASSGATFFPDEVNLGDTDNHAIEMEVFASPQFEGSEDWAVQQGAGMVVTTAEEDKIQAAVEFLKWFTQDEQNIRFSVNSGYLPVHKSGNQLDAVEKAMPSEITPVMEKILNVAIDTVNENELFTPRAFSHGGEARQILEYSMSDLAARDRQAVVDRLAQGQSMEEALEEFLSDEYFDAWYEDTRRELEKYCGESLLPGS